MVMTKKFLNKMLTVFFLAGQSDFQKRKAKVHKKHQRRTDHHPYIICC